MRVKISIEKICLIDSTSIHDKWIISTHNMKEPLGIECIGAVLKENGYDVLIFQQKEMSNGELIEKALEFNPQLVGFTSYSYNFYHALELAKKIKEKNPIILNIFGGYHITFCLDELRNPIIDFAIVGEGELTTLELINALKNGDDLESIKGIAFFNGNEIKITPKRDRVENLDTFPFALRNENILKDLRVNGLMYPPPSKQKRPALIFASRGCPYNCYYCVSPKFYGQYVTYRSQEKVIEEIRYLIDQFETNVFYFVDLTFNLNKDYVKNLCKEMIKENLKIFWYVLCRPSNLDEETIKLMKEAGCRKIGFGIDSVSEEILKRINRNMSIEKLPEIFQMVSSYGIIVRGTIMLGLPWDTKDIYESILKVLNTLPIDEIRVAIFSPYPGTEFFEKYRSCILNFDYKMYDSQTPLIHVRNITPKEISQYVSQIYKDFYLSPQYKKRVKQKIKTHPELKEAYAEFDRFRG